ncbi:MAG TPA: OmpA family protein [Sphingomonadaceae bacterium]|nr:OmpA family protein [Sphingomonadaceae bacterium]
MSVVSNKPGVAFLLAMLALPIAGSLSAQELEPSQGSSAPGEVLTTVYGETPDDLSGLPEGPEIEGIISSRNGGRIQVSASDGTSTLIALSAATDIRGTGGFLGMGRTQITADSLLSGLPVTVRTVQWGRGLVASRIRFKNEDLETAAMIHGGTSQRFAQQDAAIERNAAATEALRGRLGDIDQYNLKGATNVYFDTGKWALSPQAERDLCAAAAQAEALENALLLVVGYTDSTGSQEFNQELSERRAARVVNYLQQQCGWKPYRMLTPTGMAEADPLADNSTEAGKAQNRRVAVNILVSKALDTQ